MNSYYRLQDNPEKTLGQQETGYDADEWQRWDEELVEDFGRWLSRIAKAFTIVLAVGSALVAVTWLWGKF
jgi:predicted phosphoadenosine phosphosulfate sulfurtransferase